MLREQLEQVMGATDETAILPQLRLFRRDRDQAHPAQNAETVLIRLKPKRDRFAMALAAVAALFSAAPSTRARATATATSICARW